jgi:hypothetical protein
MRKPVMNEHHPAALERGGTPRWLGRAAVLTLPVLALSALAVGTASADEDHGDAQSQSAPSPSQPVDAFADHWEEYHKGKDATQEPNTIASDPNNYMKIHEEMAQHMLGR